MFMTDDHGAWATGSECVDLHTPNLDALAAGGARFTRAYACTPVCSPSRMTYLTGKLPSLHGVQDYLVPEDSSGPAARSFLDGHLTYSEILARHGYVLGMCGKWHMGRDETAQRGFTYWHTVPGGGGSYRDPEFVTNGRSRKLAGFKTDLVGDGALDFLGQVKDRPFYLLMPFYAPHTPFDYQPEVYRQPYRESTFSCFPVSERHPAQNPSLAGHHGNRESMRGYSALITGADANVGRVLRKLDAIGARENTLVVFTADQGWNAGHHGVWGKGNGTTPFNLYEESLRVPLIWNHPGRIGAGGKLTPLVSSYDYFPTLLDYLGLAEKADSRLPGRSYAGFLRGQPPRWRDRLYFEYAYVRGVRTETLKYVERTAEWPSELYDLEADPGEGRNLIAEPGYRGRMEALRKDLHGFFASLGAPELERWRTTTRQRLFEYARP
jgi:arylsulfatase A-like enzyme